MTKKDPGTPRKKKCSDCSRKLPPQRTGGDGKRYCYRCKPIGYRKRSREKFNISSDDEKWMREQVQNWVDNHGMKVFVGENMGDPAKGKVWLTPIASSERHQLKKDDPLNHKRDYPPGKDKMQEIVRRWVGDGTAAFDLKTGIVLKDVSSMLPAVVRKEKVEIMAIRGAVSGLGKIRKYKEKDFLRHYALKQRLAALPTEFYIRTRSSNMSSAKLDGIFDILVYYTVDTMKQFTHEGKLVEGLDSLKRKQKKLWKGKTDFDRICNIAEHLVAGITTDKTITGLKKELKLYFKN